MERDCTGLRNKTTTIYSNPIYRTYCRRQRQDTDDSLFDDMTEEQYQDVVAKRREKKKERLEEREGGK